MRESEEILQDGSLTLDLLECCVRLGRRTVDLTATECNLLAFLLTHVERDLSRATLLEEVWGASYDGTARTVDTHIQRLRRKLGTYGKRISSVRGVGYRLNRDRAPLRRGRRVSGARGA